MPTRPNTVCCRVVDKLRPSVKLKNNNALGSAVDVGSERSHQQSGFLFGDASLRRRTTRLAFRQQQVFRCDSTTPQHLPDPATSVTLAQVSALARLEPRATRHLQPLHPSLQFNSVFDVSFCRDLIISDHYPSAHSIFSSSRRNYGSVIVRWCFRVAATGTG